MTSGNEPMITYEDLRDTAPDEMPRGGRGPRKLRAWQVLLFFVAVMILFYFLGSLAQYYFGMIGVLLSQLGFVILSLLFVRLMRADPREVFPIRRPKVAGLLGVLVLWVGVFFASEAISFLLFVVARDQMVNISQSMNNTLFGTGASATLTVLIVSLAPAVCEEALHRGVILSGLRNDMPRRRWTVILLSGLIFGIFHMYPVRILPTAFIGCVMAYLVLATNNMVYSAFLHLVHNGLLMLLQVATSTAIDPGMMQQSVEMLNAIPRNFFGLYIVLFGAPAPILLYLGAWLVRRAEAPVRPSFLPAKDPGRALAILVGSTVAIVVTGIVILLV